jgi:hypothetical protein
MKKLALLLTLLAAVQVLAIDKTQVTVKNILVTPDVVLVTIQESGKSFELQCTKGAPLCATPQAGIYWMVRLGKNRGYYDCANVDLYQQSANPEDSDAKALGEYCISEK